MVPIRDSKPDFKSDSESESSLVDYGLRASGTNYDSFVVQSYNGRTLF